MRQPTGLLALRLQARDAVNRSFLAFRATADTQWSSVARADQR
jgi:hypothetical protein